MLCASSAKNNPQHFNFYRNFNFFEKKLKKMLCASFFFIFRHLKRSSMKPLRGKSMIKRDFTANRTMAKREFAKTKKVIVKRIRTILQGVTYHCYTRCHGLRNLLKGRLGRKYFIEAVQMCQAYYGFELIAAEIVDNHIHIVIRTLPDEVTIARIMQYIKARIAEKYNRATGSKGAFWNERYGCKIIEESDDPKTYLYRLLWYIGYNPVRKLMSSNPRKNPIGFINCYLTEGYELPIKITLHPFFYELGNTFAECVKKFLEYEDAYLRRIDLYFS